MRNIWLIGIVFCTFLLSACAGEQPKDAGSLEYSSASDTLVIFADENTSPGGFSVIGQECNHIPRLRIWGDGHTVYSEIRDGKRRVLVGETSPDAITAVLQKLTELDYFTNPPESSFNGAGSGYRIGVELKDDNYNSFWGESNAIYQAVIDSVAIDSLSEYTPQQGYLVVGPLLKKDMFPSAPEWPADFDFRLSDPQPSERAISGPVLDFLWQAINEQPEPLTGINDADRIYAVAVFVEGISLGDPPYNCWNK